MQKFVQPTKEQVRDWFRQRRLAAGPPPAIAQMRRELGWNLLSPDIAADVDHGRQQQVCNLSIVTARLDF